MSSDEITQVDAQLPMIRIFDTTLRDGEQSPGASLNTAEKVEIARQLELLNVDIIEAGFPITSPDDFEAVKTIAGVIRNSVIAGLARCVEKDIVAAGEAVKGAARPRIHVFLATSAIHRQYKLKRAEEEIVRMTVEGVKLARTVHAGRRVFARRRLAHRAALPDAGSHGRHRSRRHHGQHPGHRRLLDAGSLRRTSSAISSENVPNIEQAVISVHCHDDLGLAVANSLAAVQAGARQVECTINGLGERAGNASLEEIVMAIKTRQDVFKCQTRINTRRIYPDLAPRELPDRDSRAAQQGHRRRQTRSLTRPGSTSMACWPIAQPTKS